jgi:predicted NUDIX family NTP pyrophosphohydrolase
VSGGERRSGRHSAGLLLHRRGPSGLEVFLVHPGGPFWARKDAGAWSIPKGEFAPGEDPLATARREFHEETGFEPPPEPLVALGAARQAGGKTVHAWAAAGDVDAAAAKSNTFEIEWPPRSGRMQEFPEVDRAAWFGLDEARRRILPGQLPFLERLEQAASGPADDAGRSRG